MLVTEASTSSQNPPNTSLQVRARLAEALNLDLIGPWAQHELAEERLPGWVRPSNWYLTGFLVPSGTQPEQGVDADEDEELDETPASGGLAEESSEERKAAKRGFFPSSIGLSFLVAKEAQALSVTVRWGDYAQGEVEGGDGKPLQVWQRRPHERTMQVSIAQSEHPLMQDSTSALQPPSTEATAQSRSLTTKVRTARDTEAVTQAGDFPIPDSGGLCLHVDERPIDTEGLAGIPDGTRAVSVFLVNRREPEADNPDLAFAFQAEIEVSGEQAFVPRPNLRGARPEDWDERTADLHYADTPEYATGHGVSADWELVDGVCRRLRTAWIPSAEVEKTETMPVQGAELGMDALGRLADGPAAQDALRPLVAEYRAWIASRRNGVSALSGVRRETAEELLRLASLAAERMERGIHMLTNDADALDAFRVANRAVARALRQRLPEQFAKQPPHWRAFQLAFILLNLPGIADPADPHRETVDLLFFPTGGGKTEAYLGLAALAMVLRRLRNPELSARQGAGVSVIMRYTLRLLTLDQLARATGLVCALELEREAAAERYGEWPFEIGLWVGKAATSNRMGGRGEQGSDSARAKTRQFKANPDGRPSPIPLENCPWCDEKFTPDSFQLRPNDDAPKELRVACANFECDFSGERPLPILAVDEPIYRRLPAFLIATVDKFASLPWVVHTGKLLGGAERCDAQGFYGAAEPSRGQPLNRPLPPPDLIIQDELHLISGPLGTMVGLYETAIEALCMGGFDRPAARPKIVASTATVRRAQDQIQALFGRPQTQVFPPPGPDRRDSFFARTLPVQETPGRRYLGIAATGRSPKLVMRKVWLALMGAAERAFREAGGHKNQDNPADPYMTVLGYFNSLRELGGARRVLEEEVQNTLKEYGERKRIGEARGLFRDRRAFSEVLELTSRVSTNKVAEARQRLECAFHEKQRVDCAIATNMISVGLDIPRLGLMVVQGQPKAHAEYIQATSRVGRDDQRPGLVVTLLNAHKPRDRSHYERFRHYHETFYRSVEVSSVTPFSARALDRGFAGVLVGLARHAEGKLTPPEGAERIAEVRRQLQRQLVQVLRERIKRQPFAAETEREEALASIEQRVADLLDSWGRIVADYHSNNVSVQYQRHESRQPRRPLLREMLDADFESADHRKFRANRSLRDVEPEVNLHLLDSRGQAAP